MRYLHTKCGNPLKARKEVLRMTENEVAKAFRNKTWLVDEYDDDPLIQIVSWSVPNLWKTTRGDFADAKDLRLATAKDLLELSDD